MPAAQLNFDITADADEGRVEDAVDLLLGYLRNNGQIVGREFPTAWDGGTLRAYVIPAATDALAEKYQNKHVTKHMESLREAGIERLSIRVLDSPSEEEELHSSHQPSSYILFTTYVTLASPLRCGDCFADVPLYTIPPTNDNSDYSDVLCWEADYKACDTLQIHCRTGERFATRQMSDLHSSLSRQGRSLCDNIASLTGKPTYYYLHHWLWRTTSAKEEARRCPGCGGEWRLEERWHLFDFRCDACRLVSVLSPT